jgi:hypothetical protein
VNRHYLEQWYSVKTDDELLNLAGDKASLTEQAKQALTQELNRRNLEVTLTEQRATKPEPSEDLDFKTAAKWLGLWLLHSFIATFGSLINVGIITYFFRDILSRTTMWWLTQTFVYSPFHPFPVFVALTIGFFSYIRSHGSYRYWVWVLPAIGLLFAISAWKQSTNTSWSTSLIHFFGTVPFPDNRDQIGSTVLLYMSLAYALGAWLQRVVDNKFGFSPMPTGAKLMRPLWFSRWR